MKLTMSIILKLKRAYVQYIGERPLFLAFIEFLVPSKTLVPRYKCQIVKKTYLESYATQSTCVINKLVVFFDNR